MRQPDIKRISAIRKCRLPTASIRAVVFFPERGTLASLETSSPAIPAIVVSFPQHLRLANTHNGVSPSSFLTFTSAPRSSSMRTAFSSTNAQAICKGVSFFRMLFLLSSGISLYASHKADSNAPVVCKSYISSQVIIVSYIIYQFLNMLVFASQTSGYRLDFTIQM